MTKRSETEVAASTLAYLKDLGWVKHQEVKTNFGRCDIVGVRQNLIVAVECKTAFSLAVLAQAHAWIGHANYVYVAAPSGLSRFGREVCSRFGLGYLAAMRDDCSEIVAPQLYRRITDRLRAHLRAETQIMGIAGSQNSDYWTPFRATCRGMLEYVSRNPGCKLRDAIWATKHHYRTASTATSAMRQWLHRGIVPGIEIRETSTGLTLWPIPAQGQGIRAG